MPYITRTSRRRFEGFIKTLTQDNIMPGELNYIVSRLLWELYQKSPGYYKINELVGALECAKLEFYRRVAVPYEETKMEQNGDVYASSDD